jgi:hypothetical protein
VTAGGAVKRKEAALVGVVERYGGEDVEQAEGEGVRGSLGSGSSSRAAPASRRRRRYGSAVAALLLAPPPPLLPPLLWRRVGEQGIGFPRAARVGEIPEAAAAATYSGGAQGHVDGADATGGRGGASRRRHDRRAPAFPFRRQQKRKEEGDDADVGMTRGGGPLGSGRGAAVGGRRGGWLGRPTGRRQSWARSEVGGPRCNSVAY